MKMSVLLFGGAYLCLVLFTSSVQGYCYVGAPDPELGDSCRLENGTVIDVGTEVTDPDRCEKCQCYSYGRQGGAALSCCGFGIHAGVFAPPPGCKIAVEDDGCSFRLVKEADEMIDC